MIRVPASALVLGFLMPTILSLFFAGSIIANSCPSGSSLAGTVTASNGNTMIACQFSSPLFLDWKIYDSNKTLINSGGTTTGAQFINLYAAPDSKFLLIYSAAGALNWEIINSSGNVLNSSGQSAATLLAVVINNDSKITVVWGQSGSVNWNIYGANGLGVNSSGYANSTLISAAATADNKIVITVCHNDTNQTRVVTYSASGATETNTIVGPCSVPPPVVGGIAELPEVDAAPLEEDDSSGPNAGLVAGIVGAVASGGVVVGGAAWYARRRSRA